MPLNPSNTLRAVRVPSANGGRTRPAGSVAHRATPPGRGGTAGAAAASGGSVAALSSSETHWFDKYHKLLEEHLRIKQERKDQEQRLTDITTKFRKVTRDLKLAGAVDADGDAASAADEIIAPYLRDIRDLKERLAQVTAERDAAREDAAQLRKLMAMRPAGAGGVSRAASSGTGGHAGGVVDVSSLVNRRHNSVPAGNGSFTAGGGAGVAAEDMAKVRAALNDEIAKNERLAQHCEHLRAQLSVATMAGRSNAGSNQAAERTPARQPSPSRLAPAHAFSSSSNTPASLSADAAFQQQQQQLLQTNQQLSAQLHECRAALDSAQRDKMEVERELHAARGRLQQQQQQQQQQFGSSGSNNIGASRGASPMPIHVAPASAALPMTMVNPADFAASAALQHVNNDLTAQIAALSQRLDFANGQVQTLRGECERLLTEVKRAHTDLTEARRETFEAQQRLSSATVKAARADELESALLSKTEDLRRCEQELYQLVDKLKTCARETDSQVRADFQGRLRDAETLRDEAEAARRARERELSAMSQDMAALRRDVRAKDSEIEHLQGELSRSRRANDELQHKVQTQRFQATRDANDAQLVQEAVQNVMMMQHGGGGGGGGGAPASSASAAAGMFNPAEWNEKWELQQIREQAAQAILDRETAEQRASHFEQAVQAKAALLERVMEERDQLLLENLELRRRLSGVQTCCVRTLEESIVMRQQLDTSGINVNNNSNNSVVAVRTASISVTLQGIFMNGFSGLHVASLDGIPGFECGVSDPFAVIGDGRPTGPGVSLPFRFAQIPLDDESGLAQLRDGFFALQLHQVRDGSRSALVAIARVPIGASVAACLETGNTSCQVELLGGDGSVVGGATFVTAVDNAALPLALLPPIDAKASTAARLGVLSSAVDPDALRQLLLSMRAVRGVRIQIRNCRGLKCATDPHKLLTPYVFYTTTIDRRNSNGGSLTRWNGAGAGGAGSDWPLAHVIGDTAVHTRTRLVTNDPDFDVEPKDFVFRVFDHQVAAYFRHAVLSLVVYDVNCERPEEHVGIVSVPLAEMLQSPSTSIIKTNLPLEPEGSISFTVSWIR